jgi:hypothetical protein
MLAHSCPSVFAKFKVIPVWGLENLEQFVLKYSGNLVTACARAGFAQLPIPP